MKQPSSRISPLNFTVASLENPTLSCSTDQFAFEPGSPFWLIHRELVVLMSGARAAILQVAHPEIARGVSIHSDFRSDSLGRLRRTLTAVYEIAFGTKEEAAAMASHVHSLHTRVRGDNPRPYNAFSREAQLWVLATLFVPALEMYERYVTPLQPEKIPEYYRQTRQFGSYFGLDPVYGPQTWKEFSTYYYDMLHGSLLASDSLSLELAHAIMQPKRQPLLRLCLFPLGFLANELLDSPVREKLGFRSRRSGRLLMKFLDRALPSFLRYAPDFCRFAPKYLIAQKRLRNSCFPS